MSPASARREHASHILRELQRVRWTRGAWREKRVHAYSLMRCGSRGERAREVFPRELSYDGPADA